jgi:3-phenylpropionate/trans-cinnamate dioxygenase ferredoxin subunit
VTKYVVARAADIGPGERLVVDIGGRSVGVFNIDGEYFALLNRCPHAGAPLCEFGTLFGIVTSDRPSEPLVYERRGEFLRCPWHSWEFDIRTGESSFDPARFGARSYEVDVVPGSPEAFIEVGSDRRQPGPYVLESFKVTTDGEDLVVDGEDLVVVETRPKRRRRVEPVS